MKIKGKEIKIGQIVEIIKKPEIGEKIRENRYYVGYVITMEKSNVGKFIKINKKIMPCKQERLDRFREIFTKGWRNQLKANFGMFSDEWIIESDIKSIRVLK